MKTMKTTLPAAFNKITMVVFLAFSTLFTQAQELVFKNSSLSSGSSGNDGAIYRFPSVRANVDALVKIISRSDANVKLSSIDVTSSGYDNAFQPQVRYNEGSINSAGSWWMEFEITFVNANTFTPVVVNTFNVTALDIDGDNNNLHEWDAFYTPNSYTLESTTLLSVSDFTQTVNNITSVVGKKFDGPTTLYTLGVDTAITRIMTTLSYNNVSVLKFRAGATTTSSSFMTNRMYSTWFKSFNYIAPISTLPVKLTTFNANLSLDQSKVDLTWTTATEINASHFVVERSTDGSNFTEAGTVFAFGNSTESKNYQFPDKVNTLNATVIYYRLRQVDIDGKFDYSATRIVRISKQTENSITLVTYPNPVTNEVRITIPANWQNKKVAYELLNANGQTAKKTVTTSSSQTESMNVSSLNSGLYIVKVTCEGQSAIQKIIKQ